MYEEMINISCIIYKKGHYRIIKVKENAFILYNQSKGFEMHHTHLNSYYIAKAIIHYCIYGEFSEKAKHLQNNKYIKESIIRVK